jgi:hypothetical protein
MRKFGWMLITAIAFGAGVASAWMPGENPASRPGCALTVLWRPDAPTTVAIAIPNGGLGSPVVACEATELQALAAAYNGLSRKLEEPVQSSMRD